MLKYFSNIWKARNYAESNCGYQEMLIVLYREAQENCEDKYCVVNQEGIRHLDQMNWDYQIVEGWG